jgi:peptidoglycan/LPS O-acetylase OafA/YrhL
MNVYVPVWGSFSPSWSLMYEWWFYMIYPLMFFVSRRNAPVALGLMIVFSIMGAHGLFHIALLNTVLTLMICWWLGTLLADIYTERLNFFNFKYGAFFMLIITILPFVKNNTLYDIGLSIFYFGLISFLLYLASRGKHLKAIVWFKPIGDYSYTLYAIHMPILVFVSGLIMKMNNGLLPTHSYFILAFIVLIYPVSYLFYRLVEKRFIQ